MSFRASLEILHQAKAQGRTHLTEPEGLSLIAQYGLDIPASLLLPDFQCSQAMLDTLPGKRVVLKIVSEHILHKSELGGVRVLPRDLQIINREAALLRQRIPGLSALSLSSAVEFAPGLGSELIASVRYVPEVGPVIAMGPGGVSAELLGKSLLPGKGLTLLSPRLTPSLAPRHIASMAIGPLLLGGFREQPGLIAFDALAQLYQALCTLAAETMPHLLCDLELNPVVISGDKLVALDCVASLQTGLNPVQPAPPRPLEKLDALLYPQRMAVVGVSEKGNPGMIIVQNALRAGFQKDNLLIVKPGKASIEGCRCVPSLQELSDPVDLLVLAVGAAQVPGLLEEALSLHCAESILVIPGGLEEKAGTEQVMTGIRQNIAAARATPWRGPVIAGGNCLGFRSAPGRCDTLFLPPSRIPPCAPQTAQPYALISQSGAFLAACLDLVPDRQPSYALSIGNQMDLQAGDYLRYLAEKEEQLGLVAVYLEGFKPGDGLAFFEAARTLRRKGTCVLLYLAGRNEASSAALKSHTASMAPDRRLIEALAAECGVLIVESLAEFKLIISLSAVLRGTPPAPRAVGMISNAGFECVAAGDHLENLPLANLSQGTLAQLALALQEAGLLGIVDAHHPLDLTPMAGEAVYERTAGIVLSDPGVDALLLGIVPLTPALQTRAKQDEPAAPGSAFAHSLAALSAAAGKPIICAIEGGSNYLPFMDALAHAGLPVFHSLDTAARTLRLCAALHQPV